MCVISCSIPSYEIIYRTWNFGTKGGRVHIVRYRTEEKKKQHDTTLFDRTDNCVLFAVTIYLLDDGKSNFTFE